MLRYEYPQEVVPAGGRRASIWHALTDHGLQRRFPDGMPPVRKLADKELGLIAELGYEPYFLTVYDIVARLAVSTSCVGGGARPPIQWCAMRCTSPKLTRHACRCCSSVSSHASNEPPDIDVDFEHERREGSHPVHLPPLRPRPRRIDGHGVIRYRRRSAFAGCRPGTGNRRRPTGPAEPDLAWWDSHADLPQRLIEAGFDPASRQT